MIASERSERATFFKGLISKTNKYKLCAIFRTPPFVGKRKQPIKVDNYTILCCKTLASVLLLSYTTFFYNDVGENRELSASFPLFMLRVTSCHAHPCHFDQRLTKRIMHMTFTSLTLPSLSFSSMTTRVSSSHFQYNCFFTFFCP